MGYQGGWGRPVQGLAGPVAELGGDGGESLGGVDGEGPVRLVSESRESGRRARPGRTCDGQRVPGATSHSLRVLAAPPVATAHRYCEPPGRDPTLPSARVNGRDRPRGRSTSTCTAAADDPARWSARSDESPARCLRGSALGFRNLTIHIARSLLEAGGFRPRLHLQSGRALSSPTSS